MMRSQPKGRAYSASLKEWQECLDLSPLEKKRVMNATVNVNQAFLTDKNRPHLLSLERN